MCTTNGEEGEATKDDIGQLFIHGRKVLELNASEREAPAGRCLKSLDNSQKSILSLVCEVIIEGTKVKLAREEGSEC